MAGDEPTRIRVRENADGWARRLYEGPSAASPQISMLQRGEEVQVYARQHDWLQISTLGPTAGRLTGFALVNAFEQVPDLPARDSSIGVPPARQTTSTAGQARTDTLPPAGATGVSTSGILPEPAEPELPHGRSTVTSPEPGAGTETGPTVETPPMDHVRENGSAALLPWAPPEDASEPRTWSEHPEHPNLGINIFCTECGATLPKLPAKLRSRFIRLLVVNAFRFSVLPVAIASGLWAVEWPIFVYAAALYALLLGLLLRRYPTQRAYLLLLSGLSFFFSAAVAYGRGQIVVDGQRLVWIGIPTALLVASIITTLRYVGLHSKARLLLSTAADFAVWALAVRVTWSLAGFEETGQLFVPVFPVAIGTFAAGLFAVAVVRGVRYPMGRTPRFLTKPTPIPRMRIVRTALGPRPPAKDPLAALTIALQRSLIRAAAAAVAAWTRLVNSVIRTVNALVVSFIAVADRVLRAMVTFGRRVGWIVYFGWLSARETYQDFVSAKRVWGRLVAAPLLASALAAFALQLLAAQTFLYIQNGPLYLVGVAALGVLLAAASLAVVLGFLLLIRPSDLADSVQDSLLQLGAVTLLVFIAVSLSLAGLQRWLLPALPYRVGPVTVGAIVLTVGMFAYVYINSRGSLGILRTDEDEDEDEKG